MQRRHGRRAFAHRCRYPLGGGGAHVADGEHARHAGLQRGAPFTPAVVNSLAIAALAALGAAGDDARTNTDALSSESNNEFCLNMSKLMLFQCLAA